MAAARLAAVLFAIASAALAAQQVPKTDLILTATDSTGAPISGARIELDDARSPSWVVARTLTDGQGEVKFNLPTGGYIVVVNACGSTPWIRQINVKEGAIQSFTAKLEIAMVTESVCAAQPESPFELEAEPVLLLPLQNLALAPLPARKKR